MTREERLIYMREYYKKNKEKLKDYNRKKSLEKLENMSDEEKQELKQYFKEYYESNKDEYKERDKKWKEENKEIWNQYQRIYKKLKHNEKQYELTGDPELIKLIDELKQDLLSIRKKKRVK